MTARAAKKSAGSGQQRPQWVSGGVVVITFVAFLYLVELINQISGNALDRYGIRPLEAEGLWGVLFAPALHASWAHLIANTIPLVVLGFLMTLLGKSRFVAATAIIWLLGGLCTWLIGNLGSSCGPTDHIGASGLIFGYISFLLAFGFFVRKLSHLVVGLVVFFLYGGVLADAFPVLHVCGGVSWQGHLSGAVAGVVAAFVLSGPERAERVRAKTEKALSA